MRFIEEFRDFAVKGHMIDLAIGVIIGGAFSKIVDSIVKDLFMPIIGLFVGGFDFSGLFIRLGSIPDNFIGNLGSYYDLQKAGVAVLGYGAFITVFINFMILAFIVFLMVKLINKIRIADRLGVKEEKPAEPSEDILLLREIRDSVRSNN